jgi:hypothetical protein
MISVFAPPREDFLLGGKAMDANKDGRLTPEEFQAFMQGKQGDRFRGSRIFKVDLKAPNRRFRVARRKPFSGFRR